ncbi:MarR family winged helix-turn-helix transcriptional regulator [Lacimicrobium alkaliphilum]|uniref:MarR family transcriptional regulator n=1 Tax=Lacimicrobium alkaliphilum TaxID=1526571 RepID=A0ABQ1RGH5_9ALTE|nr:MarR family winged helix-turn-helix transcriptional regulator [Lacimicrobium alkaliphilum]GGD69558.1 MarR family transcriptional regulator [Lacimicrobium alkaliphilum]
MANKQDKLVLRLERFFPYRLSILSNKISSIIADTYKDKFAISITEWRIMAVLGEFPDISADEISARTQIEKSLISRSVSKLLKRKLIDRDMAEDDRRRSMIRLSDTGNAVYEEIVPLSYQYERALLECFSETEQDQFSHLIDRLYEHANSL